MDRSRMNISIHGPGRAGSALALAAVNAGHRVVSVHGRNADAVEHLSELVGASNDSTLADLMIIAVTDDVVGLVAEEIASRGEVAPTVHLSGALPLSVLEPISRRGAKVGSLHPLQTLPDPHRGAERINGAWVAVTAAEPLRSMLNNLSHSLGARPFDLRDDEKPIYHAAAVAAANYTLTTLNLSRVLLKEAGVPFIALRPLVDAIVANAFEIGPSEAMTGPIARGDVETVARQIAAIKERAPEVEDLYTSLARATASITGTSDEIEGVL